MSKATIVSILFGLAVLAALVYSTLDLQQYGCEICITYNGEQNCATASAPTREEATRTASDVACAPISSGMTASIQCSNQVPDSVDCTRK